MSRRRPRSCADMMAEEERFTASQPVPTREQRRRDVQVAAISSSQPVRGAAVLLEPPPAVGTRLNCAALGISTEEGEKLVGDLMRLMLFSSYKNVPVKRVTISKEVMGAYASRSRITNEIIREADRRFMDVFGYKLLGILEEDQTTIKGYVLSNNLGGDHAPQRNQLLDWNDAAPEIGLLMTSLSLILLSHNSLKKRELLRLLGTLGLKPDQEDGMLGAWDKKIDGFIKEGFISKVKGDKEETLALGLRTEQEITRETLFRFIAMVYDKQLEPEELEELMLNSGAQPKRAVEATEPTERASQ